MAFVLHHQLAAWQSSAGLQLLLRGYLLCDNTVLIMSSVMCYGICYATVAVDSMYFVLMIICVANMAELFVDDSKVGAVC